MEFIRIIYSSAIFLQFLLLLTAADSFRVPSAHVCPMKSVKDYMFSMDKDACALVRPHIYHTTDVIESIPHFAIEESAVRPSILSKYGVHGFPTLILWNSTMRMRYQGSRSVDSVIVFYEEFTGMKTTPAEEISLDKHSCPRNDGKDAAGYSEACPFPWARSPENMFQQETYLTLATIFVILRLVYLAFPTVQRCSHLAWRRYVRNVRLSSLWQHAVVFLNHAIQLFKEPCKKSNLQGARNAQAWASKSLATVSFGDASSSHNEQ